MKWLLLALILFLPISASAQFNGCSLGFCAPAPTTAAYQGPGDIVTALGFWSCSRVAKGSLANTSTNLCDLVVTGTTTPVVCTLRSTALGVTDLTAYCTGSVTPATACTSGCSVTKAYNQITPGTLDMVQATAANMPALTFSATPNSLPVMGFTLSPQLFLASNTTVTQAAPLGLSSVFKRTATTAGGYLSASNVAIEIRGAGSANAMGFGCGSTVAPTATDNQWDAVNASCSSSANSGAININGTDTTGQNTGTSSLSGATMQLGKSNAGQFVTAGIAESILFSTGPNSTQRGQLCTNQKNAYSLTTTTC